MVNMGKGWHRQSERHSLAKSTGKAGPVYSNKSSALPGLVLTSKKAGKNR